MIMEIELGKIYKAREPNGSYTYFEVMKIPSWFKPKEDQIYVSTRTPYTTSLYCQVETSGLIDKNLLLPLNKKTKRYLN